jgi:hypothetical protein
VPDLIWRARRAGVQRCCGATSHVVRRAVLYSRGSLTAASATQLRLVRPHVMGDRRSRRSPNYPPPTPEARRGPAAEPWARKGAWSEVGGPSRCFWTIGPVISHAPAVVGGLAACANGTPDGTVTGTLIVSGGLGPGMPRPLSGTIRLVNVVSGQQITDTRQR